MTKYKLKSKIAVVGLLFVSLILLSSCETYHLSTQSLLEQLADTQKEKKINVIIAFPFFFPGVVNGNSLRQIKVLDQFEKEIVLSVSNRMSVRITKKDGERKKFYFDTLLVQDSTINGKNDHFFGININPINLNNIKKIEIKE